MSSASLPIACVCQLLGSTAQSRPPGVAQVLTFSVQPLCEGWGGRLRHALEQVAPVPLGRFRPCAFRGCVAEAGDVGGHGPADTLRFGLEVSSPRRSPHGVDELGEVVTAAHSVAVGPDEGNELVASDPVAAQRQHGGEMGRLPGRQLVRACCGLAGRHAEQTHAVVHSRSWYSTPLRLRARAYSTQ